MRKRLIKTLYLECGKLYSTINERRILLAKCEPKIEIYEYLMDVPILGRHRGAVKKHHMDVLICGNPDYTRNVDEKFLRSVTRFELEADIQREDGIFENMVFVK